jgi:hypothetical protein
MWKILQTGVIPEEEIEQLLLPLAAALSSNLKVRISKLDHKAVV